jgi:hypothetical protein
VNPLLNRSQDIGVILAKNHSAWRKDAIAQDNVLQHDGTTSRPVRQREEIF